MIVNGAEVSKKVNGEVTYNEDDHIEVNYPAAEIAGRLPHN